MGLKVGMRDFLVSRKITLMPLKHIIRDPFPALPPPGTNYDDNSGRPKHFGRYTVCQ